MACKLETLQENRSKLAADIKALHGKTEQDGYQWTGEDEQEWTRLNKAYDDNLAEIEAENLSIAQQADRAKRMQQVLDTVKQAGGNRQNLANVAAGHGLTPDGEDKKDDKLAMGVASWFKAASPEARLTDEDENNCRNAGFSVNQKVLYLPFTNGGQGFRRFRDHMGRFSNTAMSSQDGATGGYLTGETLMSRIEYAMIMRSTMMQVAEVITTGDGNPLRWPTVDDTDQTGDYVGESNAVSEGTAPPVAQQIWYAHKLTPSYIRVPNELLRDSAFNIAEMVERLLGERLGRFLNAQCTTGAAKIQGIVTRSTAGNTTASGTAITFDELIDLQDYLDPAIESDPGTGYMFHKNIKTAIRKLKTSTGYIWSNGTSSGAPDEINGKPWFVNMDMQSSIATATKTVLYGNLNRYKIRLVGGVRLARSTEVNFLKDETVFTAFLEGDGNLLNPGDDPVRHMLQA